MKRPVFQATFLVVVSAIVLPLFGQPAQAGDSTILRCAPSFERCAPATMPYRANVGNGAAQRVAKLGARYVFEGGGLPSESFNPRSVGDRYSLFVRVGGIAGL